jgi:hypothetical protein
LRGHDSELSGDEIERAHHGDLLQLAGSRNAQFGSPFCPCAGQIKDGSTPPVHWRTAAVARQRLLRHQLKTRAGLLHGRVLTFQGVAGSLAGKTPFLRNTAGSREGEMRLPGGPLDFLRQARRTVRA